MGQTEPIVPVPMAPFPFRRLAMLLAAAGSPAFGATLPEIYLYLAVTDTQQLLAPVILPICGPLISPPASGPGSMALMLSTSQVFMAAWVYPLPATGLADG